MSGPGTTARRLRKQSVRESIERARVLAVRRMRLAVRQAVARVRRAGRERQSRITRRPPPGFERHWERIMLKALRLGGVSEGNSVTVYCDGDAGR